MPLKRRAVMCLFLLPLALLMATKLRSQSRAAAAKTSKTRAKSQIPWRVARFIYGSAPMGRQQAAKHDGRRKDRPATFPNVSRNIYRNRLTPLISK